MYPKNYDTPLSLDGLNSLVGVVDVVYNPLRTPLVLQARERGIKAEGGLYMLVAQAVKAAEFFLNEEEKNSKEIIGRIYDTLSKEKENIVLIGMPSCGKSTIGELLAKELKIVHADTDGIILDSIDMSIKEYFEKYGEEHFRDLETSVTKDVAKCLGAVISTGGGVVLRKENVDALKQNGRIYFLDRPLEKLMPTSDRPTALSRDALHALYKERIDVYRRSADVIIDASGDPCDICNAIRGDFGI